jgi:RimJ/RimL family protein N-acetyltransferase
MIEIVPYYPEHAWTLARTCKFPCIGNDPLTYAKELWVEGMSFSALSNDKEVIGCAGIKPMWRGVGTAWTMLSPNLRKHPFFLHRAVKRHLERLAISRGMHRVEMVVMNQFEVGKRWAKSLGFASEGVRKQYTPDKQDIEMFVRLF